MLAALVVGCDASTDDSSATVPTSATADTSVDTTLTSTSASTSASNGQPYIGPLTFDWAADCTIPVTETVTKGELTAHLSYGLEVVAEGTDKVVSLVDMTVADINGRAPSDSEISAALAVFRLPSFVVDEQAAVVEVRGVDELLEDIAAAGGPGADAIGPGFRQLLSDTVASKYWDTWAGSWASLGSIDEPRFESVAPTPIGDSQFDTRFVVESLGSTDDGLAILRQTHVIEGDDFLLALGLAAEAIGNDDFPEAPEGATGHRITTIDLTTDPLTLRPASAQLVIEIELTAEGETQSDLERRTWAFDWASSGCDV